MPYRRCTSRMPAAVLGVHFADAPYPATRAFQEPMQDTVSSVLKILLTAESEKILAYSNIARNSGRPCHSRIGNCCDTYDPGSYQRPSRCISIRSNWSTAWKALSVSKHHSLYKFVCHHIDTISIESKGASEKPCGFVNRKDPAGRQAILYCGRSQLRIE